VELGNDGDKITIVIINVGQVFTAAQFTICNVDKIFFLYQGPLKQRGQVLKLDMKKMGSGLHLTYDYNSAEFLVTTKSHAKPPR